MKHLILQLYPVSWSCCYCSVPSVIIYRLGWPLWPQTT